MGAPKREHRVIVGIGGPGEVYFYHNAAVFLGFSMSGSRSIPFNTNQERFEKGLEVASTAQELLQSVGPGTYEGEPYRALLGSQRPRGLKALELSGPSVGGLLQSYYLALSGWGRNPIQHFIPTKDNMMILSCTSYSFFWLL